MLWNCFHRHESNNDVAQTCCTTLLFGITRCVCESVGFVHVCREIFHFDQFKPLSVSNLLHWFTSLNNKHAQSRHTHTHTPMNWCQGSSIINDQLNNDHHCAVVAIVVVVAILMMFYRFRIFAATCLYIKFRLVRFVGEWCLASNFKSVVFKPCVFRCRKNV